MSLPPPGLGPPGHVFQPPPAAESYQGILPTPALNPAGSGASDDSDDGGSYGTLPGLPPPPQVGSIGPDEASYLGYGLSIAYQWSTGLLPVPIAAGARSVPVQTIRTNTGYCVKTVTAVGTRIGSQPQMPSWDTQSDNEALLGGLIGSFAPGKMPDGTPVYGVIVQYVYALRQAPGPNDLLDMGATPFDLNGKAANVLNPADFLQYLVGPALPVTPPAGSNQTLSGIPAFG